MRVNVDLFDPQSNMDSDFSSGLPDSDFGFAFNDSNFSDRVLRIEIMPDLPDSKSDGDACSSIADWARNRKRRREEIKKDTVDVLVQREQILQCNMPDTEDGITFGSGALGEEATGNIDPAWSMDLSTVLRVKTVHISSPILAAKSPFFYKLFSNGMRESEQRYVTLRIHASGNCSNMLLRNLPMTCESALLYLDLPSSVLMADAVQPLTDTAKQFLAARYKDISKFQEEVLNLPLAGIEAVLASDDLQIASEDAVYDFALKWARTHYPKLEERREILGSRLGRLIRFPYMTCRKLKKVLTCNDFDPELASKVVLESLFFKAETPYRQRALAAEEANSTYRRFVERAYKYRPVKVVEFELPRQQCVVYLDLKREECAHLFPAGRIYSQAFHLGGQGFFLSAHCNMDQQSSFHCFGLFLGMQEKGSVSFAVDYEFAARIKPTEEYVSKYKGNYTFTGGKAVGYRNLFGIPWTAFMADDSIYFINGNLHLRAELTIRQ
ncbi:hypothetical protein CUMW_042740 [Citrus unshiu]|nr:hypothetical protein CUMW_042740 [Citrus unshiu]